MLAAILAAAALQGADPANVTQTASAASAVVEYPAAYFRDENPDTAFDMVRLLPGFRFDGGANIRGFAGADGNVRIDGELPPSRRDSLAAILSRMPASAVLRIDLISGGAEGVDMQGQTLVANVIRKPGVGFSAAANTAVSVFETGKTAPNVRVEFQNNNGARRLEGSLYYNDNLDAGFGPRVRGLNSPVTSLWDAEGRFSNYGATAAYEAPMAGGRIRMNASLAFAPTRGSQRDFPEAGSAVNPSVEATQRERRSEEVGLRYSRELSGGTAFQLIAYQQFGYSELDSGYMQGTYESLFEVDRETGESILRGTFRLPRRGAWSFDGGAEATLNWLDSSSAYEVNGSPVFLPAADVRVEELRGEVFGAAAWAINPRLTLQTGLRIEASNISSEGAVSLEKDLVYVKPRAILSWRPQRGRLALLRIEREVGQLSFDAFSATASLTNNTIVAGNPDLEPEASTVIEARYEHRFGERGAFVLQLVHREIDNVVGRIIVVTPNGVYEAPGNVGDAVRNAAIINAAVPLDDLGVPGGLLRGSVTLLDSDFTDHITGEPRSLSGEAPLEWSLRFTQDVPGGLWRWGADISKVEKSYTYLIREIDTDEGEPLVGAFVEYRPRPDVTLRLEGLNLLDRTYSTTREVYSAPRDVGTVVFRESRDLTRSLGGRGLFISVRKTFE